MFACDRASKIVQKSVHFPLYTPTKYFIIYSEQEMDLIPAIAMNVCVASLHFSGLRRGGGGGGVRTRWIPLGSHCVS